MGPFYRVFRGTAHAVGLKPDGDTVAFAPHDRDAILALPDSGGTLGRADIDSKSGTCDIRFQGIDALETHYRPTSPYIHPSTPTPNTPKPSAGNHRQPKNLGRKATAEMLGMLGIDITDADWHPWGYLRRVHVAGKLITEKYEDGVECVVVADTCDRRGRVLGWVFPGSVALNEGDRLGDDALADMLKYSVNAHLLTQGLAYSYYFFTLSNVIRKRLSIFTRSSIRWDKGVQSVDSSSVSMTITTVNELNNVAVIWPYLFRKLLRAWYLVMVEMWQSETYITYEMSVNLPVSRLFETGDPYVYVVPTRSFNRLSHILHVNGYTITMDYRPHEIMFLS